MQKKEVGRVLSLFISKNGNRLKEKDVYLDTNGIVNDKYYGKNIQRSVLLVSTDSYDLVKQNDININYGQLGENILMDYNPYHLNIGSKIQIGDAILEISQKCTLCKSLSKVSSCLSELLKDDRGIFAKVIENGMVTQDDKVYILDNIQN